MQTVRERVMQEGMTITEQALIVTPIITLLIWNAFLTSCIRKNTNRLDMLETIGFGIRDYFNRRE